jgi:CMP/dCMP kinase
MIIAIDGPSGVGKGTVARAVAGALGYRHVDTGAMYRAVAWRALRGHVPFEDEAALTALAERLVIDPSERNIHVDGVDITGAIRNPEIDRGAARVARVAGVRAALVAQQRDIGRDGGVVMEGRDIGTVVFPDADVKIYLDASADERVRRRVHDQAHNGCRDRAQVATELAARDTSDRTRAVAPLAVAPDAHVIDTTGLTIEQVVAAVLAIVPTATRPAGRKSKMED